MVELLLLKTQIWSQVDKRRQELLEKQVVSLKQEKQLEEMKRLEAESALKVPEL